MLNRALIRGEITQNRSSNESAHSEYRDQALGIYKYPIQEFQIPGQIKTTWNRQENKPKTPQFPKHKKHKEKYFLIFFNY